MIIQLHKNNSYVSEFRGKQMKHKKKLNKKKINAHKSITIALSYIHLPLVNDMV